METNSPQKPEYKFFKDEYRFEHLGAWYHIVYGSVCGSYFYPHEYIKDGKQITREEWKKAFGENKMMQGDPTLTRSSKIEKIEHKK